MNNSEKNDLAKYEPSFILGQLHKTMGLSINNNPYASDYSKKQYEEGYKSEDYIFVDYNDDIINEILPSSLKYDSEKLYENKIDLQMGLKKFILEHRIFYLGVPRQVGKSTFVKDNFNEKVDLLFYRYNSHECARLINTHSYISTKDRVDYVFRGKERIAYDTIFFDEIDDEEYIYKTIEYLIDNQFINKYTKVVILTTKVWSK